MHLTGKAEACECGELQQSGDSLSGTPCLLATLRSLQGLCFESMWKSRRVSREVVGSRIRRPQRHPCRLPAQDRQVKVLIFSLPADLLVVLPALCRW